MCGIAGLVASQKSSASKDKGTKYQVWSEAVERMVDALHHRGPDGRGVLHLDGCILGHTRLSIIDPAGGRQPMKAAEKPFSVTFNGEIYGYQTIKKQLTNYPFQTQCDTEVLLALYDRYGDGMFPHLPGMFAFAIWDEKRQKLVAGRDRFGEKPFFYAWSKAGELVFASELNALLASRLIEPKIDKAALVHYFRRGHIPAQRTVYSNVFSLPPAHFLIVENGRAKVERYWKPPQATDSIDAHEAVEELRRLFDQAVERQMVADVPLGVFLSGGLDSSTVVAAAQRRSPLKLKTMAFGFTLAGVNELPYAREVARMHGTDHIEVVDNNLRIDVPEMLDTMSRVYSQPFGDGSNIPTYLLCREARKIVTVALSGDGADELLAGYRWLYQPLWRMAHTPMVLARMQRVLRIMNRALGVVSRQATQRLLYWQRWVQGAQLRHQHGMLAKAHAHTLDRVNDGSLQRLGLGQELDMLSLAETQNGDALQSPQNSINPLLHTDATNMLPGLMLQRTDRASMAHGLEVRAPFLDVDFASFCMALPDRLKMTDKEDKWLLRRAYERDWPSIVRNRPKQGFGSPISEWIKQPGVAALKKRLLDNSNNRVFEYISFEGSRPDAAANSYQTWSLLCLALWMENNSSLI